MTWGALRFQLQTGAPGVGIDLVDEYLNTTYEEILEATDWVGLHYHTTLQTQAAYFSSTDTATWTVGNQTLTGASTSWTSALVGSRIYRPGDQVFYTITAVGSTTSLTLDRGYEGVGSATAGTVYSGAQYVIMQHIYTLPTDVRSLVAVINPITGLPMDIMTKSQLDASAGTRALVQWPMVVAPYDDSAESSPPVVKQIEFYPPPQFARGYAIEYLHAATGWDGSTTSSSPLPFISSTLILNGCRAKMALHLKEFVQAQSYKAEFNAELRRLLLVEETQKRAKRKLRMVDQFTRHRAGRVSRGYRNSWGAGSGGPY